MPKAKGKASGKAYRTTDKWAKTNVMLRDSGLNSYIPLTKRLSQLTLGKMLGSYQMVYVKPTFGSMGRGVMRVEKSSAGGYNYQLGGSKKYFRTLRGLYASIRKDTKGKSYLIQRGIHLLTYEGRAFDMRVVVQKSPYGGWETTGTVARVAHPDKIVTNGSQGGTILPVEQVLGIHSSPGQIDQILSQLERVGVSTMKRLRKYYPSLNEIGLDVAIDNDLRVWILEVNTKPDHCPFAILQDQTMIRRIVYYGGQYGRKYKLNCNKAKAVL
ncbi:YheC/YheD family protein [Paenibacillus sp. GCM10027627]|uniref:YheC/YheD family protein n=1 Tax=unclassified Paenibacillus TaxID=185978 RepID=UPI003625657D